MINDANDDFDYNDVDDVDNNNEADTTNIFFFYTLIILKQVSLEYLVSFCTPKFRYEIYTQ